MNFKEAFDFLSGVVVASGGLYVWLKTSKSKIKRDIKINDVEGNKAMVEQIDSLLTQITIMSDSMLKDKMELSNTKTKEIRYIDREKRFKQAIELIKKSCENCKVNIETILKDFEL